MRTRYTDWMSQYVWKAGAAALAVFLISLNSCNLDANRSLFEMEALPYGENALAPHISAETMNYHYGKHYAGYVRAANRLAQQSRFRGKTPDEVIRQTHGRTDEAEIFNQVCQAWNHAFFWKSLKPGGGGRPGGELADEIEHAFGGFDPFQKAFIEAAGNQFGNGWVWLVADKDKLKIMCTSNADTPIAYGLRPLFVVDVWEHAYYLDYRNQRADYVKAVLAHLANWDFAAKQLEHRSKQ